MSVRRNKFYGYNQNAILLCMLGVLMSGSFGALFAYAVFESFNYNCILGSSVSVDALNVTIANYSETEFHQESFILETLENSYRLFYDEDFQKDCPNYFTIKTWGSTSYCEYFIYYPAFSAIVAFLWGTMLIVFRGQGNQTNSCGIPRPWRIVFPTIFLFAIFALLGLIYVMIIESKLTDFCDTISKACNLQQSCSSIIKSFMHEKSVFNSFNFDGMIFFARFDVVAWSIGLGLILFRCLTVADFNETIPEIVREHKTEDPDLKITANDGFITSEESPESFKTRSVNSSKFHSKEDLDSFRSAHSELATFSPNAEIATKDHPIIVEAKDL